MANNANIEALTKLITECRAHVTRDETAPLVDPIVAGMIADYLASRGVLAISDEVLTEQAVEAGKYEFADVGRDYERAEPIIRHGNLLAWLSRLAKGETM